VGAGGEIVVTGGLGVEEEGLGTGWGWDVGLNGRGARVGAGRETVGGGFEEEVGAM